MPGLSPRPWKLVGPDSMGYAYLVDAKGDFIAGYGSDEGNIDIKDPNWHHIVACVNALKEIPTDILRRAESACLINDQEIGLSVYINCGPGLKSRASDAIPLTDP